MVGLKERIQGFTRDPFPKISKCSCGPVELPEDSPSPTNAPGIDLLSAMERPLAQVGMKFVVAVEVIDNNQITVRSLQPQIPPLPPAPRDWLAHVHVDVNSVMPDPKKSYPGIDFGWRSAKPSLLCLRMRICCSGADSGPSPKVQETPWKRSALHAKGRCPPGMINQVRL